MERFQGRRIAGLLLSAAILAAALPSAAQAPAVLTADELGRLVPPGFYFEGQLGPTQLRNAAGIRLAAQRHFIVALVDTSGYATNIRNKYEGFIVCDDAVLIGGTELRSGAYGFGFTENQKLNILDVGGKQLLSVSASKDEKLQSPRPLMITQSGKEFRLYRGKSFVVVAGK
jgi:hypothetical protein